MKGVFLVRHGNYGATIDGVGSWEGGPGVISLSQMMYIDLVQ
jgi:hypothetical protein